MKMEHKAIIDSEEGDENAENVTETLAVDLTHDDGAEEAEPVSESPPDTDDLNFE